MFEVKELDDQYIKLCFELDSDSIRLWSKRQWEKEFYKKEAKIFALFSANKIIGVCSFDVILDEAHINYFLINQKYRRKGLGRYLMKNLISQFKILNLEKVLLEVSESNSGAQEFYNNLGFYTVGKRTKYYKDGSDAVLKEK